MKSNQWLRWTLGAAIAAIAMLGCDQSAGKSADAPATAAQTGEAPAAPPAPVDPLKIFAWSPVVFSGAEPRDEADFASLSARNVQTLVCVDSSGTFGDATDAGAILRLHVPVRYDGMNDPVRESLVTIARNAPTPIYVYSFDGATRSAAAAAVIARERGDVTAGMVNELMSRAGARKRYNTLWRAVESHRPNTTATVPLEELPKRVSATELGRHMSQIGRVWPALGSWRGDMMDQPAVKLPDDIEPMRSGAEALTELFDELLSDIEADHDQRFLRLLRKAHLECLALQQLLQDRDEPGAMQGVSNLAHTCRDCHNAYRNGPGIGEP